MKNKRYFFLFFLCIGLASCSPEEKNSRELREVELSINHKASEEEWTGKSYTVARQAFDLTSIPYLLDEPVEVIETEHDPSVFTRYHNGSISSTFQGFLYLSTPRSEHTTFLKSFVESEKNEQQEAYQNRINRPLDSYDVEDAKKEAEKLIQDLSIHGLELAYYYGASVDEQLEAYERTGSPRGILIDKDGSERNLTDELEDFYVFFYHQILDGVPVCQYSFENNVKGTGSYGTYAIITVDPQGVVEARLESIYEEPLDSSNKFLISEAEALRAVEADLNLGLVSDEMKVTKIEGTLMQEAIPSHGVVTRKELELLPFWIVELEIESEEPSKDPSKGTTLRTEKTIRFVDAQTGEILR